MPEMKVDIEVWCACGEGLCHQSSVEDTNVTIEPCKKCLEKEYEGGREDGYSEGYKAKEEEI